MISNYFDLFFSLSYDYGNNFDLRFVLTYNIYMY